MLDVLEPGELCGELSLLDGGNRSTTAVALTDVETLVLERPEFVVFLRKQPDASLDVLSALAKRIRRADKLLKQRVQDPNELIEGGATLGDRVADTVASFGGSWRFIGLFIGTMALWILWNLVGPYHFDPAPFMGFNLILSMLAALQAPIIMMSQNRTTRRTACAARPTIASTCAPMVEIAELHEKFDRMRGEIKLQQTGGRPSATAPPTA